MASFNQMGTCAWRIVISPMIPQDFPSCYYSSMHNLAVLVIHLIATLARLLGPGGVRSLVAESLLLKHQLVAQVFSSEDRFNMIRLARPGGFRSVVVESVLLYQTEQAQEFRAACGIRHRQVNMVPYIAALHG